MHIIFSTDVADRRLVDAVMRPVLAPWICRSNPLNSDAKAIFELQNIEAFAPMDSEPDVEVSDAAKSSVANLLAEPLRIIVDY